MDTILFERMLSSAFSGGETLCRELRLTGQEAAYLQAQYGVSLTPLGESWYEITFQGALQ